jgi:heat-inducible transcriptional repressor
MDTRKRLVLTEIVDRYIKTGTPVSSQQLLEVQGLSVSSATIRNDMKALERSGHISKPYTSAGRVPSQRGYRFFADWLLELDQVLHHESFAVMESYEFRQQEIEKLLNRTALLLANLTGLLGFVLTPRLEATQLKHISLIKVDPKTVLAVVVSDLGLVESRFIPAALSDEQLAEINRLLRRQLLGRTLEEIRVQVNQFFDEIEGDSWVNPHIRAAFTLLREIIDLRTAQRLALEGVINLLRRVFDDAEGEARARELLGVLEDRSGLIAALKDVEDGDQVCTWCALSSARRSASRSCGTTASCTWATATRASWGFWARCAWTTPAASPPPSTWATGCARSSPSAKHPRRCPRMNDERNPDLETADHGSDDQEVAPEGATDGVSDGAPEGVVDVEPAPEEAPAADEALTRKEAELAEAVDRLKRLQAEFQNYKKRKEKEQDEVFTLIEDRLLREFLPLFDDAQRAIARLAEDGDQAAFSEGMTRIFNKFEDFVTSKDVRPIEAVGEKFDPALHEVLTAVADPGPPHRVLEEFERGYTRQGRLLRPSRVIVSKPPAEETPPAAPDDEPERDDADAEKES